LLKDPRFFDNSPTAGRVDKIYETYAQFTPERRAQLLTGYRKLEEFARRFVAAGGKIHAGSDPHDIAPGFALHIELQLLVNAGLSASAAIQGASLNVAQAWGKEKDYGSVETGKVADLDIIDGDLIKDMTATENMERVFKDGTLVGGTKYKSPVTANRGRG